MAKKQATSVFVCENCGEEYMQWQGKCSTCGNWNTIKEVRMAADRYVAPETGYTGGQIIAPVALSTITSQEEQRFSSTIPELDRVLGGGIVQGSVILLGGDPGIGKSTLILQLVGQLAQKHKKPILYVSGEESVSQISLRAKRLHIDSEAVQLLTATNVSQIEQIVTEKPPFLLVIDSIQTMYDPAFPSTPGSLVQVRESALRLQHVAKQRNIPIILVGHITKEGTVAGPRTLEHMVDVVLYLEGDPQHSLRVLRAVKNRFGDSSETGLFAMEDMGLTEVKNPGSFLLQERVGAPGSVITAIQEGTRPLLTEVQALVIPSNFGYPKRTASGFDLNRLNLLLAVLQKRAGVNLSTQDVFVNVVGGLKIKDPAVDAAICVALASAFNEKALPETLCVMGEVGLAGELRAVSGQARREKEITALGYVLPKKSKSLAELLRQILPH